MRATERAQAARDPRAKEGRIFSLVKRILYTDLVAAAATQVVAIGTLPSDAVVLDSFVDVLTAWTDAGSISGLTIDVGVTGGNTDLVIDALELVSGAPAAGRRQSGGGDQSKNRILAGQAI